MLVALGVVVSLAAAARSTWSPCGASMLSTLTPLSERGRRARFATTASWFVVGAVLGGAGFGAAGAALAALVRLAAPGTGAATGDLAAAGALAAAGLLDLALARRGPLGHGRQVNERWLDQFRPWVYGAGFGAQIGAGLATYVTTAGVYLVLVLGALSASPPVALCLGVLFGLGRGLAVLAGRPVRTPEALRRLHARFDALDAPSRRAMVAVELAAAPLALAGGWSAGRPAAHGAGPGEVAAVLAAAMIAAVGLALALRAGRGVSRRPSPSPSGSSGA
ncbi:MAG: hypothetical protein ACYCU7_08110 [Acidimicrobiales bacterium]